MSVLWKCCLRSLKENKRRTIVTILGVALATALITAIACMGSSAIATGIALVKVEQGDWHGRFYEVGSEYLKYFQENQSLETVSISRNVGYAYIEDCENVVLKLVSPEADFIEHGRIRLSEGRMPEREGEVVLGREVANRADLKIQVGDEVALSIGEYFFDVHDYDPNDDTIINCEDKKYKVVGIVYDSDNLITNDKVFWRGGHNCNESYAYVYEPDRIFETADVLVRYKEDALKHYAQVNQGLLDITSEVYQKVYPSAFALKAQNPSMEELELAHKRARNYEFHEVLAVLETVPSLLIKETDYALLYVVIIVTASIVFLLIILAGVFCIDNSFDMSFMERIRFYGMLSSVGTTKRQKRSIVWIEAFVIGLIGIPLGILLGIVFTFGMTLIANSAIEVYLRKFHFSMVFDVAWWGILIAILLSSFMVCMSAMGAASHASKIMPIEAIRMNEHVKSGKKKQKRSRTPRLIRKLFGIGGAVAWQNFRRAKVKYRATVTSIAVSVSLFLGMAFIPPLFDMLQEDMRKYSKWSLDTLSSDGFRELLEFAENNPEIKDYHIYIVRSFFATKGVPYDQSTISGRYQDHFTVYAMNDQNFLAYCEKLGIDGENAMELGIAQAARYDEKRDQNGVLVRVPSRYAEIEAGAVLRGVDLISYGLKKENLPELEIKIACQTDILPDEIESEGSVYIFVSESFAKKHGEFFEEASVRGYFDCDDAYSVEEQYEKLGINSFSCMNFQEYCDIIRFVEVLVFVFLISFIIVIILIGLTNIINVVSTNMDLRAPEFAKLRAVGMSEGQFKAMLWTEGFFIGGKGLLFGIPIGWMIAYGLYRYYWESTDKTFAFGFQIPILQTVIAILVVAIMMACVLRYSRKRISKKNLIETIRGENI